MNMCNRRGNAKSTLADFPKVPNNFGRNVSQRTEQRGNESADFWEQCSRIQKESKKLEKIEKKLLTFLWEDDKIHKLTCAGHRRLALNLENDTEQETQKRDSNSE